MVELSNRWLVKLVELHRIIESLNCGMVRLVKLWYSWWSCRMVEWWSCQIFYSSVGGVDIVVDSSNRWIVELVALSNRRMVELVKLSSRRIVKWWNGEVAENVESSNPGIVKWWSCRIVEWWNWLSYRIIELSIGGNCDTVDGVVDSSIRRMVDWWSSWPKLSNRRIVD